MVSLVLFWSRWSFWSISGHFMVMPGIQIWSRLVRKSFPGHVDIIFDQIRTFWSIPISQGGPWTPDGSSNLLNMASKILKRAMFQSYPLQLESIPDLSGNSLGLDWQPGIHEPETVGPEPSSSAIWSDQSAVVFNKNPGSSVTVLFVHSQT